MNLTVAGNSVRRIISEKHFFRKPSRFDVRLNSKQGAGIVAGNLVPDLGRNALPLLTDDFL
jgi:hypothetical protein